MDYTGTLVVATCPRCSITHAIPEGLYREVKRSGKSVYCPLGHPWHYARTVEQDLAEAKRDAEYYRNRLDSERQEHARTQRSLSATKGVLTRTKRRIAAGICPCCNRTFQQLARHMASQHPDFKAEGDR